MTLTTRALILTVLLFALLALLQTLRLSTADAQTKAATLRAELAERSGSEWETASYTLQASLAQCQGQWADVKLRGDQALAQAQRQRGLALDQLDHFRSLWDSISSDCDAALSVTDIACAALEGF